MKTFKLTEFTHPSQIFLHQENLRANREWAGKNEVVEIPKFEIKRIPSSVGLWNIIRQLRP